MLFAFQDTETTGATHETVNSIWQIGTIIVDENLNEIDRLDLKFKPRSGCKVEKGALEKTGMSIEYYQNLPLTYAGGYEAYTTYLQRFVDRFNKKDKLQFVAYNAPFDSKFIRQFMVDNGDNFYGSYFWHPPICVMMQAAWMTRKVRDKWDATFKLEDLCRAAGIEWDEANAHDAMYDIEKTLELYKYFND